MTKRIATSRTAARWVKSRKTGRKYKTYKSSGKIVVEYANGQIMRFRPTVNRTPAQKLAKRRAAGKKAYRKPAVKAAFKKQQKRVAVKRRKVTARTVSSKVVIPKGKLKGQKFTKGGTQYIVRTRKTAQGGHKRYASKV